MLNARFQKSLRFLPQATPPIWFMRQAGRYQESYRNLRQKWKFEDLCKNPDLSTKVTLAPIEEFDFDAAILFSDLLFPLEALGFGLKYGPRPELSFSLNSENIKKLKPVNEAIEHMVFQKEALKKIRQELSDDKSLIGFVGGPWTLYTYALEGAHKGYLTSSKIHLDLMNKFFNIITSFLIQNIKMQFEGGAEVVMVMDTAAGEVSPLFFEKYLSPRLNEMAQSFPKKLGYYSKGTQQAHLKNLDHSLWQGFGVDHRWDLKELFKVRNAEGPKLFLQGNFDPSLLLSKRVDLENHLKRFLAPMKELNLEDRSGWICSLGHGVLPATPEDNVKTFVNFSREMFS